MGRQGHRSGRGDRWGGEIRRRDLRPDRDRPGRKCRALEGSETEPPWCLAGSVAWAKMRCTGCRARPGILDCRLGGQLAGGAGVWLADDGMAIAPSDSLGPVAGPGRKFQRITGQKGDRDKILQQISRRIMNETCWVLGPARVSPVRNQKCPGLVIGVLLEVIELRQPRSFGIRFLVRGPSRNHAKETSDRRPAGCFLLMSANRGSRKLRPKVAAARSGPPCVHFDFCPAK